MRCLLLAFPLPLLLIGCGDAETPADQDQDTDGDGLMDSEESTFGTDPAVADSDEDGLSDKEEFDLGTSGTSADTDEDGYTDADEVSAGVDPTDASSVIYTGGWPYNADKDSMEDPGWGGGHGSGDMFPRFAWTDQFGETVDIYDYANDSGVPIILDLSGVWCYWCNEVAKWMDGKNNNAIADYYEGEGWYDELPDMVANGEVYWVTVLDADVNGAAIHDEDLVGWYETYDNPDIAILGDADMELASFLSVRGYPSALAINSDMTIEKYSANDYTKAFSEAYDMAIANRE